MVSFMSLMFRGLASCVWCLVKVSCAFRVDFPGFCIKLWHVLAYVFQDHQDTPSVNESTSKLYLHTYMHSCVRT